ncbi:Trichodiene oxygenase [Cytospora mali]|uniref:Trichodiene oxygenase n=1 Tax=Cytospora mali TaxID=578113 RepID=A0A194WC04_CYTMA|nr:Trichodiene oxygenase [Valsa mali]
MGYLIGISPSALSFPTWAVLFTGLLAAYLLQLTSRRLYFSPISHIPGPKLATVTWLYEFYYDVILGGQYTFKILDLHNKYGPIIRINPVEVHVADKDFFHELYTGPSRRRDKGEFYAKQFGADDSVFSAVDHDLHRIRRAALNPFFSASNVRKLQGVIEEQVDNVLMRFVEQASAPQEPLDLVVVFAAFTNDVINEYSFGRSEKLLNKPDFGRKTFESIMRGTFMGTIAKHMPWSLHLINSLPDSLTEVYVPGWDEFNNLRRTIRAQIHEIQSSLQSETSKADVSHNTIFHDLLASASLPPAEKTVERLAQDGQVLNQAGTLTTSNALCIAAFHLLDQPDCLRRLRDELFSAIPDPDAITSISELQQLRYLGAVVKESLRLGFAGVGAHLSRVAPDETLRYIEKTEDGAEKIWAIPPGTPVGMTPYQILTDPDVYVDPFDFVPQRWLQEDTERLERYLIVFNAGTRVCLGQNLAKAELFLMLAKLFRRWGGGGHVGASEDGDRRPEDAGSLRLFETTVRDTQMAADRFVPVPYSGSKGIRVVLEGRGDVTD